MSSGYHRGGINLKYVEVITQLLSIDMVKRSTVIIINLITQLLSRINNNHKK